jgi:hypothetical protein
MCFPLSTPCHPTHPHARFRFEELVTAKKIDMPIYVVKVCCACPPPPPSPSPPIKSTRCPTPSPHHRHTMHPPYPPQVHAGISVKELGVQAMLNTLQVSSAGRRGGART